MAGTQIVRVEGSPSWHCHLASAATDTECTLGEVSLPIKAVPKLAFGLATGTGTGDATWYQQPLAQSAQWDTGLGAGYWHGHWH